MSESTVAAGYAKALFDFAVSRGADRAGLLQRAEIEIDHLLDMDRRLPMPRFVSLMRAAKELCDDPALALEFGAATQIDKFSIVGLICYSCETMGEAFDEMNRYGQLVIEVERPAGRRFQLVRRDGGLWIEDRRANPNGFPELTESTFARFVGDWRRVHGDVPFAKCLHVTHAEPVHSAAYGRILQVPVVFDSDCNALQVEPSWPSIQIGQVNHCAFGVLSERARALLERLENAKTTRGRVEGMLIPVLHTGEVSAASIARQLGISRQTLYRRLRSDGTSFEKLHDELRRQMALHYLGNERLSVTEVAYLVGFSDPSAFSRAFKRWTGCSPGRHRSSLGKAGEAN